MSVDYYAILGLEPDADLDTIKVSYRQLVRENHPDIASDKVAANARMAQILEAWRVLSDPDRRARYDAERRGKETRAADTQTASTASAKRPVPPPHYGARRSGTRSANRSANPKARMLEQVNRAAHLYFQEGRAGDAVSLCQRVLKADSKNLEATILLGDIYSAQGNADMALVMYDRALLLQPHNLLVRNKREKLRPPTPITESGSPVPPRPAPQPSAPTPAEKSGSIFQRLKSKLKG